jgi:HD superfamily phosphohydrolase
MIYKKGTQIFMINADIENNKICVICVQPKVAICVPYLEGQIMEYEDAVYGPVEITEPVLLDLMETAAVRRLQGIMQHGITALIGITEPITRFDHSVGAMLLVRRLGGSIAEQIAALLHDVSHTAFSHVIDHVFDGADSQGYHDEMKASYVAGTELPDVLARFGFTWTDFLDEAQYPLLEQPLPRLCADRIDYCLRDSRGLGIAESDDIVRVLDHLVVHNGRLAMDDLQTAQWLAYTFIQADDLSWANFREVGLYELAAHAIRRGLQVGAITEDDFWLTDEPVWARLHAGQDDELQALLKLVSPKTQFAWDETEATFHVSTKLRAIDPDVVVGGELRPLSTLDPDFAQHRHDYLTRKRGQWPIRVVGMD